MAEQAMERIQAQLAQAREQVAAKLRQAQVAGAMAATISAKPEPKQMSEEVRLGIAAGNINISSTGERMELSESSHLSRQQQDELVEEVERTRKMQEMHVPADDHGVILKLRAIGEPVTLFGEDAADRRIRLKELLSKGFGAKYADTPMAKAAAAELERRLGLEPMEEEDDEVQGTKDDIWYHKGPDSLKEHRQRIANYSLPRAQKRLARARLVMSKPDQSREVAKQKQLSNLALYANYGSQVGDSRPLSFCRFAPDAERVATASWTGLVHVWSTPECKTLHKLRGHSDRASAVAWHPRAAASASNGSSGGMDVAADSSADGGDGPVQLASCGVDGTVHLWSLKKDTPSVSLEKHPHRVARVGFHPSGDYLATTCFDHSWRLWDVETQSELLHQEGHSNAVYGVAFHPDGSLCATTSLDMSGRVWDLRTGKNIMMLQGHMGHVLAVDFAPNGYQIVTGSSDHAVRVWDLRKRSCVYTLPAHNNLISDIRYHESGNFFATSSYDQTIKVPPPCYLLLSLLWLIAGVLWLVWTHTFALQPAVACLGDTRYHKLTTRHNGQAMPVCSHVPLTTQLSRRCGQQCVIH
eukprot:m.46386 g.46386  ORF g.46386 m.46386 type:complete len:583 (+) comp10919_c0_seq5:160-1908(+)